MADSEQVIQLQGNEDIHALRRIVSRAQGERVLLVVPNRHKALRGEVRVKMLARQAYAEQRKVALVTGDSTIRSLARRMNLSTFGSVEEAVRHSRWGAGQGEAVGNGNGNGRVSDDLLEWGRGRQAVLARERALGRNANWGEYVVLAGLMTSLLIVFFAILILLVPNAQVVLVPRQEPYDVNFALTVDVGAREGNATQGIIPGSIVRQDIQGTFEVPTTGVSEVPSEPARGIVTFINIIGEPATIPAGTVVTTSSGSPIRFRTTADVALPGGANGFADAPIEAASPGPRGNVGPQQISRVEGAAASIARVLNQQPITGGTVTQRAVVAAADRDALREQLREQLRTSGEAALRQMAADSGTDGIYILAESIGMEVTAENYSGVVNDQLDVLRLDMRARISAIAVPRTELDRLAGRNLNENIPTGYQRVDNRMEVTPGAAQTSEEGLYALAVTVRGYVGATIDGERVRELVRGQPLDIAQLRLEQNLNLEADPLIRISPDWWDRVPYLPLRIFIQVVDLEAAPPPAPE